MHAGPVRRPLEIEQVSCLVEGRVSVDVVIPVRYEVGPRCRAEAGILNALRLDGRVIVRRATAFKECTNAVREPQPAPDSAHRPGEPCRYAALGDHERYAFRHAVRPPHIQNVLYQLWLAIQRLPVDVALFKRIVLEGNES